MTKYAVCKGRTLVCGFAEKTGKDTVVTTKNYRAGDLVELDDEVEVNRLLQAGVIRELGSDPAQDETSSGPTVTSLPDGA